MTAGRSSAAALVDAARQGACSIAAEGRDSELCWCDIAHSPAVSAGIVGEPPYSSTVAEVSMGALAKTAPTPLSTAAIAAYAEKVGEHYQVYDDHGRADLDELIRILGGRVELAHDSESLHVRKPGDFTVFVPRMTSARRDRFTVAHELGHYFLHYIFPGQLDERRFNRGASNVVETQANVFAASLLMPVDFFRKAWKGHGGDSWAVARQFDVSPNAADVRAQVLSLE